MTDGRARSEVVRLVDTGDQPLCVAVRPGAGTRTPLLVMNGIGARWETLQPFVDALDPDLEVIRFDAPGVGGSPEAAAPYSLGGLAGRLVRVLDELGHDRVDVLGMSWGGGLAQQFAVSHGARLRRLVLVATGPGWLMVPAHPAVLARMATPRRYSDPEYLRRIGAEIYGGTIRTDPAALANVRVLAGVGRGTAYRHQLLAMSTGVPAPLLALVRAPALILAGDDDPLIPLANSAILNLCLRGSRRHVYEGGHVEIVARPERIAGPVEEFLRASGN